MEKPQKIYTIMKTVMKSEKKIKMKMIKEEL